MSEQIITKTCRTCKQTKPISEFHKEANNKDGHRSSCKVCRLKYQKEYQQTEQGKAVTRKAWVRYTATEKCKLTRKQYRIHHPEYDKAKQLVNDAIASGKLPRANTLQCHYCPDQAEQYHHHKGYEPEHWLDVVPACRKCHRKLHLK